jgi:hypothetical protein
LSYEGMAVQGRSRRKVYQPDGLHFDGWRRAS